MKGMSKTTKNYQQTIFLKPTRNQIQLYLTKNTEAKNIAEKYDIAERVDCFAKSNAFVTLKDPKENF